MASEPKVRAAGAVLWKPAAQHGVRVALVHRPRYRDWSLPKGKADGGESAQQTAEREVLEETGSTAAIGRALTQVSYEVSAGLKTVQYFAARATGGRFTPNKEVDKIEWLPIEAARDRLSYEFDLAVLDTFAVQPAELATVVLVRHAKAGHRESYDGDDAGRPLDAKGRKQAKALVGQLLPFGVNRIVSAPVTRCVQTVQPTADARQLPVQLQVVFGEEVYRDDPAAARRTIAGLAGGCDAEQAAGAVVVASQGGVIPGVVKSLAARAGVSIPDAGTPKASFWVLSFDREQLVQADPYPPPEI
ncbi:NUDIX domain-containing protein [Nakamurella aerolata]|uniref:NUDIX hydrolase n=1 Tax=Nakamurella aerolata TaxID=1656892 RepID=A0A849AAG9_9ACTN|nr:NUDIX hydrolase [Nakamurella aerolata]